MENVRTEESISFLEILKLLRKKIVFIIILTMVSTSVMVIRSIFFTTPVYEAFSTAVIVKDDASIINGSVYTQSDILMYEKIVETYVEIAKSNLVIDKTAEDLKTYTASQIKDMISASQRGNTQIIEMKVRTRNKNDAINIIDVFSKNFLEKSKNILNVGKIQVLDSASYVSSNSQNQYSIIGLGFIFGLLISVGLVLLKNYIDSSKIRSERQIASILNIPVVVTIY